MTRGSGLHHISKRKRINRKHEPYPHPRKWIRWLDMTVLAVAIIGPLSNIPQIMRVYMERDVSGLSLVTWIMFFLMSIPWLIYGIVHREKPIITANILWFITNIMVVVGILIHSA